MEDFNKENKPRAENSSKTGEPKAEEVALAEAKRLTEEFMNRNGYVRASGIRQLPNREFGFASVDGMKDIFIPPRQMYDIAKNLEAGAIPPNFVKIIEGKKGSQLGQALWVFTRKEIEARIIDEIEKHPILQDQHHRFHDPTLVAYTTQHRDESIELHSAEEMYAEQLLKRSNDKTLEEKKQISEFVARLFSLANFNRKGTDPVSEAYLHSKQDNDFYNTLLLHRIVFTKIDQLKLTGWNDFKEWLFEQEKWYGDVKKVFNEIDIEGRRQLKMDKEFKASGTIYPKDSEFKLFRVVFEKKDPTEFLISSEKLKRNLKIEEQKKILSQLLPFLQKNLPMPQNDYEKFHKLPVRKYPSGFVFIPSRPGEVDEEGNFRAENYSKPQGEWHIDYIEGKIGTDPEGWFYAASAY